MKYLTDKQEAHVNSLYARYGTITADLIIDDAKQPDSPLNGLFEWDVEKAALEHWRNTARIIIHSVRIVDSPIEIIRIDAPVYIRDPNADPFVQGYISIIDLKKDPERALDAFRAEYGRAQSALERADAVAKELGLEREHQKVQQVLRRTREKAERRVQV